MAEFKKRIIKNTVKVSLVAYGVLIIAALGFSINYLYKQYKIAHLIKTSTMTKVVQDKIFDIADQLSGPHAHEADLKQAMELYSAVQKNDPHNITLQEKLTSFKNTLIQFGINNYINSHNFNKCIEFYESFSQEIPRESYQELSWCYKQLADKSNNIVQAQELFIKSIENAKQLLALDPSNTAATEMIKNAKWEKQILGMVKIPFNNGTFYYIDKNDVTVAEYDQCVYEGKCEKQVDYGGAFDKGNHPVVGVTWYDANNYCMWVGKKLPTVAQWEKAAMGQNNQNYICGLVPTCFGSCQQICASLGSCRESATCEVGSHTEDRSPYGVYDMAGNVENWCNDTIPPTLKVIKGGAWNNGEVEHLSISYQQQGAPDAQSHDIGFRCVYLNDKTR